MFLQLAVLLMAAVPADSLPSGTQLTYRGQFVADKAEPGTPEKNFELTFVSSREPTGANLYWISEERGQGSWSWLDRFGKVALNDNLRYSGGVAPTLMYQRADGSHVVPVLLPLLTYTEPLADGVAWIEDRLEHKVTGSDTVGDTDAWRIEVRGPIGRKRVVWVDKETPVVLAVQETVFVGQGEQHSLRYELTGRTTLDEAKVAPAIAGFEEFIRLRDRLQFTPQNRDFQWTGERLALLRSDLPAAIAKAEGTPLAKFAQLAAQESKNQKDRSNAIGAMQGKLVGNTTPKPNLETIAGEAFAWKDLEGKVTVLHFWEYRDTPLEEPYGQVAYLDFLFRKHAGGDVRMFGIVADQRVTQADERRAGIQSAKRLQTFMNLSYPLLVDGGEGVKQFGDPRVTGAKLPLFVVIDRKGKVIHYHVGHYEVNRDRGLEELEQVIMKALETRG